MNSWTVDQSYKMLKGIPYPEEEEFDKCHLYNMWLDPTRKIYMQMKSCTG